MPDCLGDFDFFFLHLPAVTYTGLPERESAIVFDKIHLMPKASFRRNQNHRLSLQSRGICWATGRDYSSFGKILKAHRSLTRDSGSMPSGRALGGRRLLR